MKRTLPLLIGLITGGFMVSPAAWGQSNYATPYTFGTIAGTAGNLGGRNGLNGGAQFYFPEGITVDTNGNLYVVDSYNNNVREVMPVGTNWAVTTVAGGLNEPAGIAVDAAGNLYVANAGDDTIRKITPAGAASVIAGTAGNSGGNDGTNGTAQFNLPSGLAVDASSNLYVADNFNDTIRMISPVGNNWVVTTIAGKAGNPGSTDGTNGVARFYWPASITIDSSSNLYVADSYYSTIRKITPMGTNWVVTTIAGTAGNSGSNDGTNADAQFNNPSGITVDANGNLFVADTYNNTIRKVAPAGTNWVVTTLAGVADGSQGGSSNGVGANALFASPYGVTVDGAGNVYVADTGNGTIREGNFAVVPYLAIGWSALNGVVVSWPGLGSAMLQTNASLTTGNWVNYGGEVSTSNGTNSVTLPPLAGSLFFRLSN